jgi:hypothetical protein
VKYLFSSDSSADRRWIATLTIPNLLVGALLYYLFYVSVLNYYSYQPVAGMSKDEKE